MIGVLRSSMLSEELSLQWKCLNSMIFFPSVTTKIHLYFLAKLLTNQRALGAVRRVNPIPTENCKLALGPNMKAEV